ncbi:MAG: diaminohydroxyphosphoribosylaminopyrimidine deaminase [Gemmatimonadota bacterium]|jgi:diaminohydroxyphosphoribosylaminopyrimidine deaminase/5-amino-6-(5-phosphoribosylamino)uracil reductase
MTDDPRWSSEAHARLNVESPDVRFMRQALTLAERGAGQVSPNPKVGALVVKDGEVVGEGWHARYGEAHAEVHALRTAGAKAHGATLYVTLEPCNHHGKTPPCVDAILEAGITRVVCALRDPNPVAAGGLEQLRSAGLLVEHGTLADLARIQNAPFLHRVRVPDLPFVTLKLATSLDGAIVDATRRPGWITGPESRRAVHALRAEADAVAIGIGTALADDPALTVRDVPSPRQTPTRVVFDRHARLPLDSTLVRTAGDTPLVVITAGRHPHAESALRQAGARVVIAADMRRSLQELRALGLAHVLVEGGAVIASELLAAGLVQHLIIFQAPVILGAGAVQAFGALPSQGVEAAPRLRVLDRREYGADLMTRYAVSGD